VARRPRLPNSVTLARQSNRRELLAKSAAQLSDTIAKRHDRGIVQLFEVTQKDFPRGEEPNQLIAEQRLAPDPVVASQAVERLAGQSSDGQSVQTERPSTTTIAALDAALPPDSRTLVIGLTGTFWFQQRVRGGGNFDGPRVSAYLETPTPEALRDRLRRDGITHIAVISAPPATQVAKKIEERETALTPEAQRSLAQLLDRYAANVTQRGNAALFALR